MTHLDSVKTGAAANRRASKKDPMELLVRLREAEPTAGKERIFGKWRKTIHADDEYEEAVDLHCFNNLWTEQDRVERMSKANTDQMTAKAMEAKVVEVASEILLMKLLLPMSGKRLGEATFADCRQEGGWLTKISKMGKPHEIVGQKLKETTLRDVAKEFKIFPIIRKGSLEHD